MGGWNGAGAVTLTYDWTDDDAADVPITASRFDTQFEDVRGAIQNTLTLDGQNSPSANIPFGGRKITGYGTTSAPSARSDVAALSNIQDSTGVYVGTVAGTGDAITLTPAPAITAYAAGQKFFFTAGAANTVTNPTVAVSGLTAKTIKKADGNALLAGSLISGALHAIIYNGTDFLLLGIHIGPLNMFDALLQRPVLKDYGEEMSSPTSTANAVTFDITNGNHFQHTLTENTTLTLSNPTASGDVCGIMVYVIQGASAYTFAWPAAVKWIGSAPVITTTSGATDIFSLFTRNGGTTWAGTVVGQGFASL